MVPPPPPNATVSFDPVNPTHRVFLSDLGHPTWIWVAGGISCIVIITCVVVLISLYTVRRFKRNYILTKADQTEFFDGSTGENTALLNDNNQNAYHLMKFNAEKFEIAKNEFQFGDSKQKSVLGEGNFGFVYKVKVTRFDSEVAVKVPRDGCSRQTMKSLLCEIKIMSFVGDHENIIKFLGAYTKEIKTGVLFIVTELCTMGSLQTHLQKMGTITKDKLASTIPQLFRFCFEIASGMQFISEKGVIHGDLAARNVLLDTNAICKITDFGLSRKLYQYQVYIKKQQEELPWRWLAIEALRRLEFSTKSDAWSYGMTLWEIFSLGDLPYPGLSWTLDFVELLDSGMRLTKPKNAPHNV
ncbi:unnamed protein product [Orchesella dallaii]|uniref:Protein kinase domain-containing protein n=1 Tax=Orchesella dallaii TaxID=48710 RepID=A0ABP1PIY6_9HEXA